MRAMRLEEIQAETKQLLHEFDRICCSLGISYSLMYGTLIGAIRHKGFIPWDDDLDVIMMPDDYDVLEEYILSGKDDVFEIHNPKTKPNVFFNMTRICDKEHLVVFDDKAYTSGLFIDIYVLRGLGNDSDLEYWNKWFKKVRQWRKCVYLSANNRVLNGNSTLHKILNIPWVLIAKAHGTHYYFDKMDSYPKYDIESSSYVGIPQWEDCIYPKEWFDETIRTQFEDIEVSIIKEYDVCLTHDYGDYMQPPKLEQRVPHHGYTAYSMDS